MLRGQDVHRPRVVEAGVLHHTLIVPRSRCLSAAATATGGGIASKLERDLVIAIKALEA